MTDQRQGTLIRQLQGKLGGKARHEGRSTVTWPGAQRFADVTITHGFDSAPNVQVTLENVSTNATAFVFSVGASTFTVRAWDVNSNPAAATVATVHWEAWL
jgi:hypothetical protein